MSNKYLTDLWGDLKVAVRDDPMVWPTERQRDIKHIFDALLAVAVWMLIFWYFGAEEVITFILKAILLIVVVGFPLQILVWAGSSGR